MKILILDDRKIFTADFVVLAEASGENCVAANTIEEAFDLLRKEECDVLLCDMMLPGESHFGDLETMGGLRAGIFFCQYARAHFPEMRIYLLTSGEVNSFDRDFLFGLGIKMLRKQSDSMVDVLQMLRREVGPAPKTRFFDALELKPGAFGLKVDLRKLTDFVRSRHR